MLWFTYQKQSYVSSPEAISKSCATLPKRIYINGWSY